MKSSYVDAVVSLVPDAQVSCNESTGEITWHEPSVAPVTTDAIETERSRLGALRLGNAYQRKRAKEYPSTADQFDLLYHGGYDAWKAAIDAVKTKYPKG